MVEFVFVANCGEEVVFYLFTILYSLYLELLSMLGDTAKNPATRSVGKGTDSAPDIGRNLGFGGLCFKIVPFNILYFS